METTSDALFSHVYTIQDQGQVLQGLRQLMTLLYEDGFSLETHVQRLFVPGVNNWLLDYMQQSNDRAVIKNKTEGLISVLTAAPVCACDVARPMRADFYYKFILVLREYTHQNSLLLDLRVQPSLLGGIRFTYKGLTYDFTVIGDFLRTWNSSIQQKVTV